VTRPIEQIPRQLPEANSCFGITTLILAYGQSPGRQTIPLLQEESLACNLSSPAGRFDSGMMVNFITLKAKSLPLRPRIPVTFIPESNRNHPGILFIFIPELRSPSTRIRTVVTERIELEPVDQTRHGHSRNIVNSSIGWQLPD